LINLLFQVKQFEHHGRKVGCSSTEALLQDMGHKCKTVRQLISYLEQIDHDAALELLKPEGRPTHNVDLCT